MRKKVLKLLVIFCLFLFSLPGFAVMFTWRDADGSYHATDRLDKLPPRFQKIFQPGVDHYVTPQGVGYDRDEHGNYHFFDHSSPGKLKATRTPPPENPGPPGDAVTPRELAEIRLRYLKSGKEPKPTVTAAKVVRIISADTFELENGQKVTYIGAEFPEELKGDTKIHKEAVEYQKKIMLGKTVHLTFGPKRFDEKGRLLAYVFVGKDLFMNADLIMNGYARAKVTPPNTDYKALFQRLENFAKRSMLGLWDTGELNAP